MDALNAHIMPINLNATFYTHIERSPTHAVYFFFFFFLFKVLYVATHTKGERN